MDDRFNIYVDRLQDGREEHFSYTFDSSFMDIHEAELQFKDPITVEGHASVADGALFLLLTAHAYALMPCAVCNTEVKVGLSIKNAACSEEVSAIRDGKFNYRDFLRESLLLELPHVAECNNGSCGRRKDMAELLKKNQNHGEERETFYPFADLSKE